MHTNVINDRMTFVGHEMTAIRANEINSVDNSMNSFM